MEMGGFILVVIHLIIIGIADFVALVLILKDLYDEIKEKFFKKSA